MATAAERAKEKADRMAARRQPVPAADAQDVPTSVGHGSSRTKATVRLTVDLAPQMHADLEDWARDTARAVGRVRVTRVDVVRELVRQLLEDPDLAQRVRGRWATND
jgi:hypothetical protein